MKLSSSIRKHQLALAIALFVVSLPAYSAHRVRQQSKNDLRKVDAAQRPAATERAGELKFKQNCSRCHEAPQGFSPRISGTILRHMRVRASLSEADEKEILRFLNP